MQTFRVLLFNTKKDSPEYLKLRKYLVGYLDNSEHCMPGMDRFSFQWWPDGHMEITNAGTSLGQALADHGYIVDMSVWKRIKNNVKESYV